MQIHALLYCVIALNEKSVDCEFEVSTPSQLFVPRVSRFEDLKPANTRNDPKDLYAESRH